MMHYHICKTRIRKLHLPKGYDAAYVQIGVPDVKGEALKVGLNKVGDIVLPSPKLGALCNRNANGYSYTDNTQPKKRRYVTTNWIQPFGNEYASSVACDIYKDCYPIVEVSPTGIELTLLENEESNRFVVALLTEEIRENHLLDTINIFLEIFGECYLFDGKIKVNESTNRRRCNWEILPPGERPSVHLTNQLRSYGEPTDTYDVNRLKMLERYKVEQIAEGINGFDGYYAYVFKNHCFLESAVYGNATYIIPKENWEVLSQKTKKELFDENIVIEKLVHNAKWRWNIANVIKKLENQ